MGRRTTRDPWLRGMAAFRLVALAACGAQAPIDGDQGAPGTESGEPGGTASPPDAGSTVPPADTDASWDQAYGAPDPVDVSVGLTDVSITSHVSVEHGGFLSLVGMDGTLVQLEVPAEAVVSDIEVTMTLVASVEGSPLGSDLVAAVAFEPEGLAFARPAVLTFTPATPVTSSEEGPFAAAGDGSDFHLYPLDPDPGALRMHVRHFSLYGIARTHAAALAAQIEKKARDVQAQFEQEIARIVQEARLADGSLDRAAVQAAYDHYRDTVVRPLLRRAETDHRRFVQAMQAYFAWQQRQDWIGLDDGEPDPELQESWLRGFENYVRHQVDRCHEHDLGAVVDLLKIDLARNAVSFFRTTPLMDDLGRLVNDCAVFTLEMESSTENRLDTCIIGAGRIAESARVTATVQIELGLFRREPPWTGPMQWESAAHSARCDMISGDVATCVSSMAGYAHADLFTVLEVDIDLNLRTSRGGAEADTDARLNTFRMLVRPGNPELLYDTNCEGGWALLGQGGSSTNADAGPWYRMWQSLTSRMPCRGSVSHPVYGDDVYYLDCWQRIGDALPDEVARWDYEASDTTLGRASESTRFILRHTPRR